MLFVNEKLQIFLQNLSEHGETVLNQVALGEDPVEIKNGDTFIIGGERTFRIEFGI